MSREKQTIEEMVEFLNNRINVERNSYFGKGCITIPIIEADKILDILKDCRKQSEGDWIVDDKYKKTCPICGKEALYRASGTTFATTFYQTKSNYCPNCGAHLITKPKGGEDNA